mmetsp:Transcript_13627/g.53979  ORF Transcript_13627/g.53979 Transcript_13627/m.53979 type:complete len:134 (+) Transcript_13627:242-643(+)
MSTDTGFDQDLQAVWYFLDVPLDQSKEGPILIVVKHTNHCADLRDPCLRKYDARNIQSSGTLLYQFPDKFSGLYNGIHQTLMTKSNYFVALRDNTVEDNAEYTVFVFDTTAYELQSQFTFTLPGVSFSLLGMM